MKIIEENPRIRCSKCESLLEYSKDDVCEKDFESLGVCFEHRDCNGNVEEIGTNEEFAAKCLGLSVKEFRKNGINSLGVSKFSVIKCPKCGEELVICEKDIYPLGIPVEEEAFRMLNKSIYN